VPVVTVRDLHRAFPGLTPIVGNAQTARIRAAKLPDDVNKAQIATRLSYHRYIKAGSRLSIMVIEDVDTDPGFGSWWGDGAFQ